MRLSTVLLLAVLCGCATDNSPDEPVGPDRWSGTYRYNGTRTVLAREGRYYRFSDARLGRFYFRLTKGGFLEDDRTHQLVRVFPNVRDDASSSDRPYSTLRMSWLDDYLTLIRVP